MSGSSGSPGPKPFGPAWQRTAAALCVPVLFTLWLQANNLVASAPLEWQETAMFEHARRVLAGERVYVEPGTDFAPFPYPPLFHWVGAGAIAALGESLVPLRLVSFVSMLAIGAGLVALGRAPHRTEPPDRALPRGLLGVSVFAAAAGFGGDWYAVARVDMLAMALGLWGIVVLEGRSRSALAGVVAGGLFAAACLTKQTMLAPATLLPVVALIRSDTRRGGAAALATVVVTLGATVAWLDSTSDGWFSFTVVDLLAGSPWHRPAILGFWIGFAPWFAFAAVLWFAAGRERSMSPILAASCATLIGIGWVGRAHEGGYDNTYIPAFLATAIVASRLGGRALTRRPRWTLAGAGLLGALFLGRFGLEFGTRPAESDHQPIIDVIAEYPDPVWQPGGPLDVSRRGGIHRMAIIDLLKSGEDDVARRLIAELTADLDEGRFEAIVLSSELRDWGPLAAPIAANYREVAPPIELSFRPRTGAPIGPRAILVPR